MPDSRRLKAKTFSEFTDLNANRVHPSASGMGFIIYEKQAAGRLAMGHDGGQDGFTTSSILFPDTLYRRVHEPVLIHRHSG